MPTWVLGQSGRMRIRIEHIEPLGTLDAIGKRFLAKIDDFTSFWAEQVAPIYFEHVQRNIAQQGALVGGWRALSPAYAAWKLKHVGHQRIMVLTGALRESLRAGGRGNVIHATRRQVLLGSTVPYLPYHQTGTARMPRRTVLFWVDDRRYGDRLARFVKAGAEIAGYPNVRIRRSA